MTDGVWFTAPQDSARRLPKWLRSACKVGDDIYVPARVVGDETRVMLCAMFDGVDLIQSHGHAYVPASWARQEFPANADLVETIERKVRRASDAS